MIAARQVEVAGQDLADLLRVALLGERREADEVGEQDRDVAALGDGLGGRGERGGRAALGGRGAVAAPGPSRIRCRTSRRAGSANRTTGRRPRDGCHSPCRTWLRPDSRSGRRDRPRATPGLGTV